MGEITWLEWPKGYNGWARFTLSKAVWALLAKPFWKLKVVPFNKNTKLSLEKVHYLEIVFLHVLSYLYFPLLNVFFFFFFLEKKKEKGTKMKSLWKVERVEDRFCTGRNSINFMWIPLALKWWNQSLNGAIYRSMNQVNFGFVEKLWILLIFYFFFFTRNLSTSWLSQYLRYKT